MLNGNSWFSFSYLFVLYYQIFERLVGKRLYYILYQYLEYHLP